MIVAKFLPLIAVIAWISCSDDFMEVNIIAVKCEYSDTFIYKNATCFAKSYNRSFSTINIIGKTKRPLTQIIGNVSLQYKYGTIYREVMHTPPFIDLCEVFAGNDFGNRMVSALVEMANRTAPGDVHKCPYTSLNVTKRNLRLPALISVFASGVYRMIFSAQDGKGEWIGTCSITGSVLSSDRHSFG